MGTDGILKESLPCKHCTNAMKTFGIRKVAYSDKSGQIVEMRTKDLHNTRPSSGYRTFIREVVIDGESDIAPTLASIHRR